MLFERIETKGLAHYSYLLGCPKDGGLIVVDPRRDIGIYLSFAEQRGLRIAHIVETHIHADFASGARELAELTGATVHESVYDAGETYEISFPHTDMADGDTLELGPVKLTAVHTPGHTPEHLSFLVHDMARSETEPMLLLSGDFLFVGSLGRPDLLGEDAKLELAHKMFNSVRTKLAAMPAGIEVHPAHGAGSMCGAGMSGRPSSTLGFERVANPYLNPSLGEEEFVAQLLGSVPPFPPYYRRMKRVNSEGAASLGRDRTVPMLSPSDFAAQHDAGAVVMDLRDQISFGSGNIAGSFGIGMVPTLPVWASWLVPYDTPILLVAQHEAEATEAAIMLARVGLDQVIGALDGSIAAWRDAGLPLDELPQIQPAGLHQQIADGIAPIIVDIRSDAEWNSGRIDGAIHVFAGSIEDHLDELPDRSAPYAIVCGGGYRSTAVASVLRRQGYEQVINMTGGMGAWLESGLPVTTGQPVGA